MTCPACAGGVHAGECTRLDTGSLAPAARASCRFSPPAGRAPPPSVRGIPLQLTATLLTCSGGGAPPRARPLYYCRSSTAVLVRPRRTRKFRTARVCFCARRGPSVGAARLIGLLLVLRDGAVYADESRPRHLGTSSRHDRMRVVHISRWRPPPPERSVCKPGECLLQPDRKSPSEVPRGHRLPGLWQV